MFDKITTWLKDHKTEALLGGAALATLLFMRPKASPRRKKRTKVKVAVKPKTRKVYNLSGSKKKPWQIKGSLAAKRRMAQIRKKR